MSDQTIDPPQPQSDLRQALAGRLYEANRRAAGRWDSTPWADVWEHYSKTRDEWLAVADEALASQPPAPEDRRAWMNVSKVAAPEAQREPTDEWREKLTDALAEIVRLRLRLGDDPHAPLSSEAAVPQTHANIGKRRYSEAWCLVAAARELASESDPTATIGPVGPPSPQNDWREALEAAENAIDDCHDWRSHHHHEALAKVRAALAAVPQSEPLTDRGRMLKLTADEVAEYGALCVANSQRKITAREALEEYFEYHPEAAARQVAQTATPQGDQFEYVGYVDDGDVLKYGDAPANNSCHVYRKLGPVIDLANPGRPRMAILKDMLDRGEITAEQYRREERGEASESKVVERYRSRARAIRSVGKERSMKVTDEMVSRFLNWRLPDDFAPDAGITFKRVYNETSPMGPSTHEPVGTNLLNAPQARAMLEHVLSSEAPVPQSEPTLAKMYEDPNAPVKCSQCGRKSWSDADGAPCDMPQPNGSRCLGLFRAVRAAVPQSEPLTDEQIEKFAGELTMRSTAPGLFIVDVRMLRKVIEAALSVAQTATPQGAETALMQIAVMAEAPEVGHPAALLRVIARFARNALVPSSD